MALAARSILETPGHDEYRSRLIEFQLALLRSMDCSGLIAGQALDLQLPRTSSPQSSCEISELKTVPLFSLAVKAGSLLANCSMVSSLAPNPSKKSSALCALLSGPLALLPARSKI